MQLCMASVCISRWRTRPLFRPLGAAFDQAQLIVDEIEIIQPFFGGCLYQYGRKSNAAKWEIRQQGVGSMKRVLTVVRKEFHHIFRDYRTLAIIIVLPVFLLILLGYGVSGESKDISIAVADLSKSDASRRYIEYFTASGELRSNMTPSRRMKSLICSTGKRSALVNYPRTI